MINTLARILPGTALAAGTTTPPPPPATTPAKGLNIPAVVPDFNSPGVAGMQHATNTLAAYTIVAGVAAIIIGGLMVVLGPRLSFSQAKAMGMGGIIGGFTIGGLVALSTTGVSTIYGWFAH
ncbi:hypothetical protein ABIB25_000948 [Nakamurella sp. UYEF19]|uniref:hypothetical protein n=1 Tax=Nakamurella sp. UYEF19 TaxID=1756392 RepID=UPI0033938A8B